MRQMKKRRRCHQPTRSFPVTISIACFNRTSIVMAPSSLPRIFSPALLGFLRGHPSLPAHSWYFIAGVTLSIINRPDEIPIIFQHALEKGGGTEVSTPEHAEQLIIARKMREGLVKSAAIGGLPKVLEALRSVRGILRGSRQTNCLPHQVYQRPFLSEGCDAQPTAG